MFGRHLLNLCKAYFVIDFVIETSGKHFFRHSVYIVINVFKRIEMYKILKSQHIKTNHLQIFRRFTVIKTVQRGAL